MAGSRATLKDIAEATGFSANTVSLALRGSSRLPDKTRDLILQAAERLNYRPNHIARSLVANVTRSIGLVMTDILNPTQTLAAHTIEQELSRAGYALMFAGSDGSLAREKRAIGHFLSYQVDGMLIFPANRNIHDHILEIEAGGTPVLSLVDMAGPELDVVTIDDREGAFRALAHLCGRGHRSFAMIDGGRMRGNLDKMTGALAAVRAAGLSEDALRIFDPGGHAAAHAYALMDRIMALRPKPTALFTSTDSLAFGALHWCRDHGVAVPADLAVLGYDDTEGAAHCVPALTTVRYAADEISRIGVDRILRRIEGKAPWAGPERQTIKPDLVIRGSA